MRPPARFRAIDYEFSVQSNDVELVEVIREVFFHCLNPGGSKGEEIWIDVSSTRSQVTTADWSRTLDNNRVVPAIVAHINLAAAQRGRPDAAVLHAGCVSRHQQALVLPGRSGSGKSTLTAALIAGGWSYLADELVSLHSGEGLSGYPKALTLKEGSWPSLGLERPNAGGSGRFASSIAYVRPELFGSTDVLSRARPQLLVFPRFTSGAEPQTQARSAASALVRLVECAHLPLSGEGFVALAELATSVTAHDMSFPNSTLAMEMIERLSQIHGEQPSMEIGRGTSHGAIAFDVIWADHETEFVAYNFSNNAVVHLDADGRDQWLELAKGGSMDATLRDDLGRLGFLGD